MTSLLFQKLRFSMAGIVVVLTMVAEAGCVRGCAGQPAKACKSTAGCDATTQCVRGYCRPDALAEQEKKCVVDPVCKEYGRCGADYVRTFLGLGSKLDCVAVADADCKAAKVCADDGSCKLADNGCGPGSDADCQSSKACAAHGLCSVSSGRPASCQATSDSCAKSTGCKTDDECALDSGRCVRSFAECTPYAAATPPVWARRVAAVAELKEFRDGADRETGAFDGETVLCEVEKPLDFDSISIRAGAYCSIDFILGQDVRGDRFVLPAVALRPGDSMTADMIDHELIGAHPRAFVKAEYQGRATFHGENEGSKLDCLVLRKDVVDKHLATDLKAADEAIAEIEKVRPDRSYPSAHPDTHEAGEMLPRAAMWVGWQDERIASRVVRVDAALAKYARELGDMITSVQPSARAPNQWATVPNDHIDIRVVGIVCGDALRARFDASKPAFFEGPIDCGFEVEVKNGGDYPLSLGFNGVNLSLLRLDGSEGRMEPVAAIDARKGNGPLNSTVQLARGESGTALFVDFEKPLSLGKGQRDGATILRAGNGIYFRLDLDRP